MTDTFRWAAIQDRDAGDLPALKRLLNLRLGGLERALAGMQGKIGWFDVTQFGATGNGVTDDRAAIQATYQKAMDQGGGVVYFPAGHTYQLDTTVTRNLPVAVSGPLYTTAIQALPIHLSLVNPTGIVTWAYGATLRSSVSGGLMVLMDGAQDCDWFGGTLVSPTTIVGNDLGVFGMNGLCWTATARDTSRLQVRDVTCSNVLAGFYAFGDPAGAFGVRNILIQNALVENARYGIALHDAGNGVTFENMRTRVVGRQFFLYGCGPVRGQVQAADTLGGFQSLIKAYDLDTYDIDVTLTVNKPNTVTARLMFSVEHDPVTQPTPHTIRDVTVQYDDTLGPAAIKGIEFQYLQNGVETGTGPKLFDGITLRGRTNSAITTTVSQNPVGSLDATNLFLANGAPDTDIHTAGGWIGDPSFVPQLRLGPTAAARLTVGNPGSIADAGPSLFGNATGEAIYAADAHRWFDKTAAIEWLHLATGLARFEVAAKLLTQFWLGTTDGVLGSITGVNPGELTLAGTRVRFFDVTTTTQRGEFDGIGRFILNGALLPPYRSVAVDTTLTDADYSVDVDATAAPVTITLPAAAGRSGMLLNIKKIDATANVVTIDGDAGDLIDGALTFPLTGQYWNATLRATGTGWGLL